MNISTFAERTGLTPHTLRYYEKLGLLSGISRDASGHRAYRSADIEWVKFICRLKATGMPLEQISQYAHLRACGDSTLAERRRMLEVQRSRLQEQIQQQMDHLQALDAKIDYYNTKTA